MSIKKGTVQVSTENIFPVIRQWLYTDKDIFLREIVSNAADAITKLERLRTMGEWKESDKPEYAIQVVYNSEMGTITVSDNGIGMTVEEIDEYINNIAYSGAMAFVEKYQEQGDSGNGVIGHFGLGFYSTFMVSQEVRVDSLSWQEGASPAFWISDTGMEYTMGEGDKTSRGTTITLTLSEDAKEDITVYSLRETLRKYCQFMPYPIYFIDEVAEEKAKLEKEASDSEDETAEASQPQPINNTSPLWLRDSKDITDEEYIAFYHESFQDFRDPLFWVHLNMDYPFSLKGILYFPREDERLETLNGRIKVYYNQVFVADDVKELIPDYLFLLRGLLDSPDLPLNVSRSNLQNNSNLQKLSSHIVRKVADKLKSLAKEERTNFEGYWKDISLFLRYGSLRDEKFYERVKSALLFEKKKGSYISLEELKELDKEKFYYTTDAKAQIAYINRLQSAGEEVFVMEHELDIPFLQKVQMSESVQFLRVDAEVSGEHGNQERLEQLERIFKTASGDETLKVEVKSLGIDGESAILTEDEQARQMRDMRKMYQEMEGIKPEDLDAMFPSAYTLVINTDQSLITKLCLLDESKGKEEEVQELATTIYDLARLSHGSLVGDDLYQFLQRANALLGHVEL